jgi:hypothetical protein
MNPFFRPMAIALFAMSMNEIGLGQSGSSAVLQSHGYSSPEAIIQQLKSEDIETRKKVALAVGLADPLLDALCFDDDNERISIKQVTFRKGIESRLLSVRGCEAMFLVPVVKQGVSWITLNPVRLWAKFSEPTYKFESLVAPGEQEIVVSNQTVDEGTGILQRNMTIYKVIGNETHAVFDTPEYLHVAEPDLKSPTGQYTDDQTSTFTYSWDKPDHGSSVFIREKRDERIGKHRFTVYRSYAWNRVLQEFRMLGDTPP